MFSKSKFFLILKNRLPTEGTTKSIVAPSYKKKKHILKSETPIDYKGMAALCRQMISVTAMI